MASHKIILGRIGQDGKGEVQLQIIHERKHREIDIGFRVMQADFEGQRVKKSVPQANGMNQKISAAIKAADDIIVRHAGEYMPIDKLRELIRLEMKYEGKAPLLRDYIETIKSAYYTTKQQTTGDQFALLAGYYVDFAGESARVNHISTESLTSYKGSLQVKGLSDNTIFAYLWMVKTIWKQAVKDGIISKERDNPFTRDIMPDRPEGPKIAIEPSVVLTIIEGVDKVKLIQKLALESIILECFIQGISFIDLARLRKSNIQNNRISIPYRFKNRGKKKKTPVTFYIHPIVYEIINQYESDYFLPIFEGFTEENLSSKEFHNLGSKIYSRVQAACRILGIPGPIGSRAMRHTFSTMADSINGRDWLLTKKSLGHKISDQTAAYVYIDQSEVDNLSTAVINQVMQKKIRKSIPLSRPGPKKKPAQRSR